MKSHHWFTNVKKWLARGRRRKSPASPRRRLAPELLEARLAPVADLGVSVAPTLIDDGQSATVSGSFTPSSPTEEHDVVIDWGPGITPDAFTLAPGVSTFSVSHAYDVADGLYPLAVTVTDASNNSITSQASLPVNGWRGDGNASGIFAGNDGTLVGNVTFQPGKFQGEFHFDGSSWVEIPDAANLRLFSDTPSTIAAWTTLDVVEAGVPLTPIKIDTYGIFAFSTTTLRAHVHTGTNFLYYDVAYPLAAGARHHYAQVWNGTTLSVYVDGQLIGGGVPTSGIATQSSAPVSLGRWYAPGQGQDFRLKGSMDQAMIFDEALSQLQLQALQLRSLGNTVEVKDVPPTIALSTHPLAPLNVPITLELGPVVDPGSDTVTGYTVRWGDGNTTTGTGTPPATLHYTYTTPGFKTITIDLVDEDGVHVATGTATKDVFVPYYVVTPAAGEFHRLGDSITVTWTGGGPGARVNLNLIEVTPGLPSAFAYSFAVNTANDGTETVTLPLTHPFGGPNEHQYALEVVEIGHSSARGPAFTVGLGIAEWDGGGADNNWTNPLNWVRDVAPSPGNALIFKGASDSPFNDFPAGTTFKSIRFEGPGDFILLGNALQLSGADAIVSTADIASISVPVTFLNDAAITNSGGEFTIIRNLDNGGHLLTFHVATGNTSVDAAISGGGGLVKTGAGNLSLTGANTYTGFTSINQGQVIAVSAGALGAVTAGTAIAAGAKLATGDNNPIAEPLFLAGTISYATAHTGPITITGPDAVVESTNQVTIAGPIDDGGNGYGLKIVAPSGLGGSLTLSGNNTYTGATIVEGSLRLSGGNAIADSASIQLLSFADVHVESSETIASISSPSFTGIVLDGSSMLTIGTANDILISGFIGGTGGLTKLGAGTLALLVSDVYEGPTFVNQGTLLVSAVIASPATVNAGGVLGGLGMLSAVSVNTGGALSPGASILTGTRSGALRACDLQFAPGGVFVVEIDGATPGTEFDTLTVQNLDLGGATLSLDVSITPAPGSRYRIVDNQGTLPVTGTFDGLPELGLLNQGGNSFQITYQGGDGNDIELIVATPVTVTFSSTDQVVAEDGSITVTAVLDQPLDFDFSVPVEIQPGATADARDFAVAFTTLFFPAGRTVASGQIEIFPDDSFEPDETFTIALSTSTGASTGAVAANQITILNDDASPTVFFSKSSQTGDEGVVLTLEVKLSSISTLPVTVPLSPAPGDDYTIGTTSIVIPAGARSASTTIAIVDDAFIEGSERIRIDLGTPLNATPSTVNPVTQIVLIPANDAPIISFASGGRTVKENDGVIMVEVGLKNPVADTVVVPLTIAGPGTAPSSVTFGPFETSKVVPVTITNDSIEELNNPDRVVLSLVSSQTYSFGDNRAHIFTVLDDDVSVPTLQPFSQQSPATRDIWEDVGSVSVTVTRNLQSSLPSTYLLFLSTSGSKGYATRGPDYTGATSGGYIEVKFQPTELTKTLTIPIVNDTINEPTEKLTLSLKNTSSTLVGIGQLSVQTINIKDDDPIVQLRPVTKNDFTEGKAGELSGKFKVVLSAPTNKAVTVPYTVKGSGKYAAGNPLDFIASSSASFSIPVGQTEATAKFDIIDDNIDELNETFTVRLGTPTNAILEADPTEVFTILDNDATPYAHFLTNSTTISEAKTSKGSREQTVTLALTRPTVFDVYVQILFSGSAIRDTNYTAYYFGYYDYGTKGLDADDRLFFRAGTTEASFKIWIKDDSRYDPNETVGVKTASADHAQLYTKAQTLNRTFTIIDNDQAPVTTQPKSTPKSSSTPVTEVLPGNIAYLPTGSYVEEPLEEEVDPDSVGLDESEPNFLDTFVPTNVALSTGLIEGATLFFDGNFNGIQDFLDRDGDGVQADDEPDEPGSSSSLDGIAGLKVDPAFDLDADGFINASEGRLTMAGGIDGSTELPVRLPMSAPIGYFVVTPLSTIVEHLARTQGFDLDTAESRVLDALGLSDVRLRHLNLLRSIAVGDDAAAAAYVRSVQLSTTVQQIADLFSGTPDAPPVTFLAEQVYANLAEKVVEEGSTLDLTIEAVIADVIAGVSTRTGIAVDTSIVSGAATVAAAINSAIAAIPGPASADYATAIIRVKKVAMAESTFALRDAALGTRAIADVVDAFTGASLEAKIGAATVGNILPPTIEAISTVVREGDAGQTFLEFTVRLYGPHDREVTTAFETADSLAIAGIDYVAQTGTLTWAAGDNTDRIVQIPVLGNTLFEADKDVSLLLSQATNAAFYRQSASGWILNDDALSRTLSSGTTANTFEVALTDQRFEFIENNENISFGFALDPLDLSFTGQDNVDDTLILDFSADTFRSDTITYHGGGGTGVDSARIIGGSYATVVQSFTNATDGVTTLTPEVGDAEVNVHWFGLEPFSFNVDKLGHIILELPAGVVSAILEDADPDDTVNPGMLQLRSLTGDFETTLFSNPQRITITGVGADDSFTIGTLDGAFAGQIDPIVFFANQMGSVPEQTLASRLKVADVSIINYAGDFTLSLSGPNADLFEADTTGLYLKAGVVLDFAASPLNVTLDVDHLSIPGTVNASASTSVAISNVNDAPTDITLSPSTIGENAGTNVLVGLLSATDADANESFTFALVAGQDDDDNGAFSISGNELRAKNSLDFEAGATRTVRIEVTDDDGATFQKAITITVGNVNEPIAITSGVGSSTTPQAVAENSTPTFTIGVQDPDVGDPRSFSLSGPDASVLQINAGGVLSFRAAPDFENPLDRNFDNVYEATVTVTDGASHTASRQVFLRVTDVVETPPFTAPGALYVVDSASDVDDGNFSAGQLSLREAIRLANVNHGSETIRFAIAGPIDLSATLALTDPVGTTTIVGPTNSTLVVRRSLSAADRFTVFRVNAGVSVELRNLTISNGLAALESTTLTVGGPDAGLSPNGFGEGGGLTNFGSTVLRSSTVTGNSATFGGGIRNEMGTLTIVNSTISNNSSVDGAGIWNRATLQVSNSTISQNSATGRGGGLRTALTGALTAVNATIAGNRADSDNSGAETGGGLSSNTSGIVRLHNSIVSGNLRGPGSTASDVAIVGATLATAGSSFNLIGDAGTAGGLTNGVAGNLVGNGGSGTRTLSSILSPLANNGGPTLTHALVQNSAAIATGSSSVSGYTGFDQRSAARDPGAPDRGAYEVQHPLSPVAAPATHALTFQPAPSPDANTAFVKGLYQSTLLRDPDPAGLSSWVDQLSRGARLEDIAYGFVNSIENRTNQVTFFYKYFLGRAPDPAGLSGWVNVLQSGVDEGDVMSGFLLSPEFTGQNDNASFVNLMYYAVLGRPAEPAGFNDWLNQLNTGTATRDQVGYGFLRSIESITRVVNSYFTSYLKRSLDAAAASAYVAQSQAGVSFGRLAAGILGSSEFYVAAGQNL